MGYLMNPEILVFFAVPEEMRAFASGMDGLEGGPTNFSIPLIATGGEALAWANSKGYSGRYWGAMQSLPASVVQAMMIDGIQKKTEVSFAAYFAHNLEPVPGGSNLITLPTASTYDAFAVALGVERVNAA